MDKISAGALQQNAGSSKELPAFEVGQLKYNNMDRQKYFDKAGEIFDYYLDRYDAGNKDIDELNSWLRQRSTNQRTRLQGKDIDELNSWMRLADHFLRIKDWPVPASALWDEKMFTFNIGELKANDAERLSSDFKDCQLVSVTKNSLTDSEEQKMREIKRSIESSLDIVDDEVSKYAKLYGYDDLKDVIEMVNCINDNLRCPMIQQDGFITMCQFGMTDRQAEKMEKLAGTPINFVELF